MTFREIRKTDDLQALVQQSETQGLRFVRRLVDEMTDGTNRFDRDGEALFVAEDAGRICGICGLNIDGFSGRARTSRLRHLYVDAACRGQGIGTSLVRSCLDVARQTSDLLVLRTHCPDADAFYRRPGFRTSDLEGATHEKQLFE